MRALTTGAAPWGRLGRMMKAGRPRLAPWVRSPFRVFGALLRIGERFPLPIMAILFTLAVAMDTLDSFGLDDVFERAVSNVTDTVLGPLYGRGPFQTRVGQDKIAVVLIDAAAIENEGQDGLPLSYAAQRRILERVAREKPRAIFFDVHYPRPRIALRRQHAWGAWAARDPQADREQHEFDALVDSYQTLARTIPIYLGPVAPTSDGKSWLRLGALARPELPGGAVPGMNRTGLHQVSLEVDPFNAREYAAGRTMSGLLLAPAAVGLYRAYCERAPADAHDLCRHALPDLARDAMIVRWGFGPSKWQRRFLPEDIEQRCHVGFWRYLGYGLTRKLNEKWSKVDDRRLGEHCSYTDLILFSNIDVSDDGIPLSAVLRDRLVLIGFDAPESGDRRTVPFYGDVPGVLTHAMALDNLVQWGGRPFLAPREVYLGLDQLGVVRYVSAIGILALFLLLERPLRSLFLSRETIEQRHNLVAGITGLVLVVAWYGVFLWGMTHSWPIASEVFGGVLPGGVLAIILVRIGRRGVKRGRYHA